MTIPQTERERIHWLVNGVFVILIGLLAFLGKAMYHKLELLDERLDSIPETYITKTEYRDYKNEARQDTAEIKMLIAETRAAIKYESEFIQKDYNRRQDKIEALVIELKAQVGNK